MRYAIEKPFGEVKSARREEECDEYCFEEYDEPEHYEDFAGSYAQEVEGYSDEDIYDAFDGDPDAYWNID